MKHLRLVAILVVLIAVHVHGQKGKSFGATGAVTLVEEISPLTDLRHTLVAIRGTKGKSGTLTIGCDSGALIVGLHWGKHLSGRFGAIEAQYRFDKEAADFHHLTRNPRGTFGFFNHLGSKILSSR